MLSRRPRSSLIPWLLAVAGVLPARAAAQEGPRVYEPGVFSTGAWDFFVALTPDQRTAYICRANGDFSYYTILETSLANGRWTGPRVAAFSSAPSGTKAREGTTCTWPGGPGTAMPSRRTWEGPGGFDLYVSERRNGIWQRARPLDPVSSPKGDFNHSVSPDGKYLFFSSTRGRFDSMPPASLPYAEMQRRLTGIGNGLGDIYRIPVSELGIRVGD